MKLLFTGVDPHIKGSKIDIWIASKTETGYVKESSYLLVWYRQIDMFHVENIAYVLSAPVEFSYFTHLLQSYFLLGAEPLVVWCDSMRVLQIGMVDK